MTGEEQVEIVGAARDVFITECVLDVAAVARITALSDLAHDLVTEKPSEVEAEEDKRKLNKFSPTSSQWWKVESSTSRL